MQVWCHGPRLQGVMRWHSRAQLAHVPKVNDAPATRSVKLLRRDEIKSLESISGDAPSLLSDIHNNSGQYPVVMDSRLYRLMKSET